MITAVPSARLPAYATYLKQISDNVPSSHEGRDKVQKALASITALSDGCADILGIDKPEIRVVFQVWSSFGGETVDLFSPSRRLIKELECTVTAGSDKSLPCSAYLFDDCLVAASTAGAVAGASNRLVFHILLSNIVIKHYGTSSAFTLINAPDDEDIVR